MDFIRSFYRDMSATEKEEGGDGKDVGGKYWWACTKRGHAAGSSPNKARDAQGLSS